ncbi:MAG: aromatic ring-opening dioxygenase subunit LigA [Proteobacteria bacterium]|nr:aromatic ring-opening dioxygenase subunit LigA [Pseudomonadota bacterium]
MSLYYVQKLLYQINRDEYALARFNENFDSFLAEYRLTEEEILALRNADIGLLYVMGVNGQILMHFAAMSSFAWDAYLDAMREGIRKHGPVRAGLYATVWS